MPPFLVVLLCLSIAALLTVKELQGKLGLCGTKIVKHRKSFEETSVGVLYHCLFPVVTFDWPWGTCLMLQGDGVD